MNSELEANANNVQIRCLCVFYREISQEGLNKHAEIHALSI